MLSNCGHCIEHRLREERKQKYEDLSLEQKLMIDSCKHKALENVARDLASKLNAYWLQQLINKLKLELAVKQGILIDDRKEASA